MSKRGKINNLLQKLLNIYRKTVHLMFIGIIVSKYILNFITNGFNVIFTLNL